MTSTKAQSPLPILIIFAGSFIAPNTTMDTKLLGGGSGYQEAYDHGNIFHAVFLYPIKCDIGSHRGWYRCISDCDEFHFGAEAQRQHQKGCEHYRRFLLEKANAEGQRALTARRVAEAQDQVTASQVSEAQHSVGAAPPTGAEAHQLQQHWHPSLRDNPCLIQLYSAAPHEARPELLAKIEAGVKGGDLQSVVIQWMMEAATSSHANA
eukprot:CAMPEP_0201873480 /NCGR_PEP_ID=MMETSP0902-20130614/5969_1 /ASSEMBLY_ACC=CAM_ASM_000551 /TAXON_ID=420261 /ORGANISM="Thalassiosira antarctica, Strain CCMP982" /LENGTH=207 /DNA_ID=CAMNT_0048400087 /DNA_START=69 /DNA_END=693 /DNA_ORIENTATION=+